MALVESAVGKVMVKPNAELAVLSSPKFNTATAAPVVLLYINAPLVVNEAGYHVTFAKDTYATLFSLIGMVGVKTSPPAVYPVPVTSPVVV